MEAWQWALIGLAILLASACGIYTMWKCASRWRKPLLPIVATATPGDAAKMSHFEESRPSSVLHTPDYSLLVIPSPSPPPPSYSPCITVLSAPPPPPRPPTTSFSPASSPLTPGSGRLPRLEEDDTRRLQQPGYTHAPYSIVDRNLSLSPFLGTQKQSPASKGSDAASR
ncbi:hypothetical protein BC940DRAFT_111096 [Gongronella butleri]|nr:hypothetical protein BC940DRAFT_111096 [Gongronella butleri]